MASIREQIMNRIIATLTPVANAHGAMIIRQPVVGVPRDRSPALLVIAESEAVHPRGNDRVDRLLTIKLAALARGTEIEQPEAIADRLLVAAHAALFADFNIGGLALGMQEQDCDFEADDADAGAALLPARYQIMYRTLANDISQKG